MKETTFLLLLGFLCIAMGCGPRTSSFTYTVNDAKDPNTTWRTEKPASYAEAKSLGKCPIPVPEEATNIQYVDFYAGLGGFSTYVRFEAPVKVCVEHARAVLDDFNTRIKQPALHVTVAPKPLTKAHAQSMARSAVQGVTVSQAPWFDTDKIVTGEVWGEGDSHRPIVVIDTEKGVFYYRYMD